MKPKKISLYSNDFWTQKVIEKKKRNKDGLRWIVHRFPIKGGIDLRTAMLEDSFQHNNFMKQFTLAREKAGDAVTGESLNGVP